MKKLTLNQNFRLAATDVSVHAALPSPIPGMCTRRVLAMRFVHGAKINDLDALRRVSGVDTEAERTALAEDIANAFARQLFVDGVFQADPHPGNILVCKRSMLEPGAVMFLPPAPANDPNRAIPVLLDFGLTKRLPNSKRLAFSRLICSMQSLDVSGLLLSFDEMGLVLKREDPFEDLSEFRFAFRETQGGDESRAETMAHIKKATEKWEAKPRAERNPVEAFPTELMLFFRTVFLLRGLCTSLNVRVKYLRVMAQWARRSMLERFPAQINSPLLSLKSNDLTRRVMSFLSSDAAVVGAQVCCLSRGEVACQVAYGRLHDLDSRSVTNETLFPGLSLAQAVAQLVVRMSCSDAGVALDTPICRVWPAFTDKALTIAGLISGDTTKLAFFPSALPPVFYVQSMNKVDVLIKFVESISNGVDPTLEQGDKTLPWELSTLAFAWGYAVAGLVQALDKGTETAFALRVARLSQGHVLARVEQMPSPPPAKGVSETKKQQIEAQRDKERESLSQGLASLCIDVESLFGGAIDLDKAWDVGGDVQMQSRGGAADAGGGEVQFDPATILKSLPSIKGREYFIDPRVFNHWVARNSITPSANLLASARGLAEFIIRTPGPAFGDSSSEVFGEGLGLKQFEVQDEDSGRKFHGHIQVAFGGSFVLVLPELEFCLVMMVNNLTIDRIAPRAILVEVLKEFKLAVAGDF